MKLLENEELQRMVDYSFGDHSGVLGGVPNAYMKKANVDNAEFFDYVFKNQHRTITLFIDNIRLYRRPIEYSDWLHLKPISAGDYLWLSNFDDEDLLDLCSRWKGVNFIIFTAFEDTPLDDHIIGRIPPNVLAIHAANAVIFGGKIHPFPHGIERIMYPGYDHHEILEEYITIDTKPTKLLLVTHRDDTGARGSLKQHFNAFPWATVPPRLDYEPYLRAIKNHKFVLCPSGNGIESARNWETLYMKRVPIFKDHPYLREMFKDFPALFVKEFEDVTEQLLLDNDHLYHEVQNINMDKLDLEKVFKERI